MNDIKAGWIINPLDDQFTVITENSILFELIHPEAKLPHRAEPGSSGYDLFSVESVTIEPGDFKLVSTGLKWQPNTDSVEMQIRPRSGLAAKHGITVLNAPGTVDASYRGEIKVLLINHGKLPYDIKVAERIAQAIFSNIDKTFVIGTINKVNDTTRGSGGMGSTGKF